MNILFENINGDPWRHLNGVDTTGQNLFVHEIAQRLAKRGHNVDVATRATEVSDEPMNTFTKRLRIFRIPAGTSMYTYRDNVSSVLDEYTKGLIGLLVKENLHYDIVHGNYWMSAPICKSIKDGGYANKLVFTPHSSGRLKAKSVGILNSERDKIEVDIFSLADGIHVLSDDEALSIQELYTMPRLVRKIPHGVNKKVFYYIPQAIARKEMGLSQEKQIILFVGRFEKQKNLSLALQIYERLRSETNYDNLQFVICGGTTTFSRSKSFKKTLVCSSCFP